MLKGAGFTAMQQDAIGILAINNDDPLSYRNTTQTFRLFNIEVDDNNNARAVIQEAVAHPQPFYLGAILSHDREKVYWVNETKPLP